MGDELMLLVYRAEVISNDQISNIVTSSHDHGSDLYITEARSINMNMYEKYESKKLKYHVY